MKKSMENTSTKKENHSVPINWFSNQLPPIYYSNMVELAPAAQNFLKNLRPHTTCYYSRLTPIFSPQIKTPASLNKYEIISLRDGLIPLLWFFKQFPTPGPFNCYFLLHTKFQKIIPATWKDRCGLYNISGEVALRKKLLISALLIDDYSSTEYISRFVDLIIAHIENSTTVELYAPLTHNPFYRLAQANYVHFISLLEKNGIAISKVWQNEEIKACSNFEAYSIADLNEGLLYADNYLIHHFLSKGASLLFDKLTKEKLPATSTYQLELSPYHQCQVYFDYPYHPTEVVTNEFARYDLARTYNTSLPWPREFQQVAYSIAKQLNV